MYDLIIIGSGPAGLSAAVYGKRAGLNLLIIEEKPMSGGQILNTYEVDNYLGLPGISGFDMGQNGGCGRRRRCGAGGCHLPGENL